MDEIVKIALTNYINCLQNEISEKIAYGETVGIDEQKKHISLALDALKKYKGERE